jgi:hypothetical protein
MPVSVFISYAHADRVVAEQITRDLRQIGFSTWTAAEDIPPGDNWHAAIETAIERCTAFVAALSPDWIQSEVSQAELQTALDLHKPIVPIVLRPVSIPFLLRTKQYIDFTRQTYTRALDRLGKSLEPAAVTRSAVEHPDESPAVDVPRPAVQKIVKRSGGATINAETVNIYGDVMGRDKRLASTLFQMPSLKRLALPALGLMLAALIWITVNTIFASVESTSAAMPTASTTAAPTATQTPIATSTPPAISTPAVTLAPTPVSRLAIANTAAAIFLRPESASPQLGSLAAQTSVTITGRSVVGNWFYIQTPKGLRGFVYGPYFDWSGDPKSLPVVAAPIGPAASPAATPRPVERSITLDFYPLDPNGYCNSDGFPAYQLFMRGQGSIGPFQYYIENQFVGSGGDQLIYAYVFTQPGQTFITGRVTVDDGRSATKKILLSRPACASMGGRFIDIP